MTNSIPISQDDENREPREQRVIDLDEPLPLVLVRGPQREEVPIMLPLGAEHLDSWLRHFSHEESLICNLNHLLRWPAADRQTYLRFIHHLATEIPGVRFQGPSSQSESANLMNEVIQAIDPSGDLDSCERAIHAATEVAALFHPESIRPACNLIVREIRSRGLTGYRVDALCRYATAFRNVPDQSQADHSGTLVSEVWPDAAGMDNMIIPSGWTATENGIVRIGADAESQFYTRIVITRRLVDSERETNWLELAWSRGERWWRRIFRRGELASARNIVGLADYDIPVNSNNAADLIDYLDAFESQNFEHLPEAIVSDHMGWMGQNGNEGFLWGETCINQNQPFDSHTEGTRQAVEFCGADDGDKQLAEALHSAGEFDAWRALVEPLRTIPRVLLALYASFIPPLLMILRSPSFILSYAGPTSVGKTSTLVCAAATWGCPDEQMPASLMMTWDTTRVGIERSMRVLNGIPIIIDDTKQARNPKDIAQTVYDVTGGRGRTRGSERGLAATGTWRTVMITSGEQPMASFTQDGGTRARILEVWNTPFGATSQAMAQTIGELRTGLCQNYGLAGPRFTSYLISQRGRWEEWSQSYLEYRLAFEQRAADNNVAVRMAAHFAALRMAAQLVHQALELPWEYAGTIESLWQELTNETVEADRAAVGMRLLLNYCATRHHQFVGGESVQDATRPVPPGGHIGLWRYRTNVGGGHDCRAVFLQAVNELLTREGFEPNAMKRMWRDRDWIITNPGKLTLKVRYRDATTDAIAIPLEVIERLMNEEVAPTRPRVITVGAGQ